MLWFFDEMICVSLIESSVDSMVEKSNLAPSGIVELRLDYLSDFSDLESFNRVKKKVIVSCMPSWEGGKFEGSEEERMSILSKALGFADYLTVELSTDPALRDPIVREAKKRGVKVILSFHDFNSTPDREEIIKKLNEEKRNGADIAKVAFTAKKHQDVLTLMQVLVDMVDESFQIPIIAVSMGSLGRISRILAPLLGSYLTYASMDEESTAAPGQLTYVELKQILSILEDAH